ncbi:MAG: S1C family serine protease [Acidimicrobiales bacterium]
MAAVLSLALVATGFVLARATDDDGPAVQSNPQPVIATVPDDDDSSTPPPDLENTGEPVADVAQVVAPSVVLVAVEEFGQGSGIAYSDELIVTNAHVVGSASEVSVQLSDGRLVDGDVVGTDPDRDLAVVRVADSVGLQPASFAPSDSVQVGQLAVAVGSPFGLDQTVTSGVVSAVGRVVPGGLDGSNPVTMVQTDAPINPGNSGGALVDRDGRVIGMNTAIRTETGTFSGVGFAIPSDTITLIADRIVNGESLDIAFLGVTMEDAQGDVVGALIVNVEDTSPAAVAGLESGDIVVRLDEIGVSERGDLAANVRLKNPGDQVEVEFVRDGQTFVVTVTLGRS